MAEIEKMAETFKATCEKTMERRSDQLGVELEEVARRLEEFRKGMEGRVTKMERAEEGIEEELREFFGADRGAGKMSGKSGEFGGGFHSRMAERRDAASAKSSSQGQTGLGTAEGVVPDESGDGAAEGVLLHHESSPPAEQENPGTLGSSSGGGKAPPSRLLRSSLDLLHQQLLAQVDQKLAQLQTDTDGKCKGVAAELEDCLRVSDQEMRDTLKKRSNVVDAML